MDIGSQKRRDDEHHQADHIVAPHDEIAKCLDDVAGVAVQQDQPRRRDIKRQPEQRHKQQQRREPREIRRLLDVQNDYA